MNIKFFILTLFIITPFCQAQNNAEETININSVVDAWHQAAANANFKSYFSYMNEDAIFIGTDASENWTKKEFENYAKPHFDKGKAWSFKSLERHIYFSKDNNTAWFDELLDTQMKICRGSGVLIKINNEWKIAHYVLSISVPNELSNEIIQIKSASDDIQLEKLKK